jgi:hypothetical protein
MRLEEFKEIRTLDLEIQALRDAIQQQYNNEYARMTRDQAFVQRQKTTSKCDIIDKFRSGFRRKMKKLSDHNTAFSGTRNGAGSFNYWKEGLEFAVTIGNTWGVIKHVNWRSSPTALLFYKPETIDKVTKELDGFYLKFEEIKKLLEVCDIMTS